MQLTLNINGEDKVFVAPFIKGRLLRNAIKLTKETNFDELNEETLDNLVNYVVEVYGKQFTQDDFYDGISAPNMIDTITETIYEVVGTTNVKQNEQAAGLDGEQHSEAVDLVKN
ncbi:hypothetical protein QRX25_10385 [Bacillus sp. L381]|uniref:phage tail assembly chaperone G n=1 Tax=Bacillus TaxID=1386 RepID=UPI001BAD19C4|nr:MULTISPECIES: hypothetical protein [Bacillus]MCR9040955.1 hypothetical protein [Bacillus velezensis]QUN07961.1 hypothetical protein KEF49_10240 [Bacillus amyloliquefaciens]QYM81027.1 hypothetical protein KTJ85_10090 [Bacillus sp. 7D3]QZY10174.1 hypothetical protein K7B13_10315 [Bacillus amyloliquefaciens]QZY11084.1 hypothetical protein K7B13_15315 [Bacillus amyloliquefaciens]